MPDDPPPVTLELDLRPDADQVGELHGQAQSTQHSKYLAISPPKSLFHFSVQSGLELHGSYNGKPATLVTLKAHFAPKEQARPIKWAAITAYFASDGKEPIEIVAFAPGQPTVQVECSVESDKVHKSVGGSVGVDYFANIGSNVTREHEVNKEQKYAATVSGSAYPVEGEGDIANTVRWILNGNQSQKTSGVPPDLTFGIILLRANDDSFVGRVQVDIKVDWQHNVKEWCAPFKSFNKWGNVGRHKIYSPGKVVQNEVPPGVKIKNLEELTKAGKTSMENLVNIEMPVEYRHTRR